MERIVLEHTVFFSHYPPWHPRKIVKSNKQCTVFPPEKRQPFNKVYHTSGQVNHYMGVEFVWKMVTIQGHESGCNSTPQPSVSKPAAKFRCGLDLWVGSSNSVGHHGISMSIHDKKSDSTPGNFCHRPRKTSYIIYIYIQWTYPHQIPSNHIKSYWIIMLKISSHPTNSPHIFLHNFHEKQARPSDIFCWGVQFQLMLQEYL